VFSSIGIKSRLTKIFLYKKKQERLGKCLNIFQKTKIIIRENHAGQDCGFFQNFASIAAVILWHGTSHTKKETQDNVFTK